MASLYDPCPCLSCRFVRSFQWHPDKGVSGVSLDGLDTVHRLIEEWSCKPIPLPMVDHTGSQFVRGGIRRREVVYVDTDSFNSDVVEWNTLRFADPGDD